MLHITRQAIIRWAAAVLLMLVVIYPLSYGPFLYVVVSRAAGARALESLRGAYTPCVNLCHASRKYAAYIDCWVAPAINERIRKYNVPRQ